jgi:hypothetical protein
MLSLALIIAALYVISYVLGMLLGIACGYDAVDATFESISAASNAGLSSGITAPEAPVLLKLTYIVQMWMGRLEFLTLLALFASLFASILPRRRWRLGKAMSSSGKVVSGSGELEHDGQVRRAGSAKVDKPKFKGTMTLLLLAILVLGSVMLPTRVALAQDTAQTNEGYISISELSTASAHLDHQRVDFVGEVVGDIINAENGHCWIAMSDGQASISVYISTEDANSISNLGGYQRHGTALEVSGIFNLACEQHDGLSDVHAAKVKVLSSGGNIEHDIDPVVLVSGLVLMAIGLGLACLYSLLRKRWL